jgi:alpha-aminoadipic semialdehyde synthase
MKQVSLSGHLFDKFLINEALDIIEAAGGSFQLVRCEVGQSIDDTSYSELEDQIFRISCSRDTPDF